MEQKPDTSLGRGVEQGGREEIGSGGEGRTGAAGTEPSQEAPEPDARKK
ncbi:hypothetical protein [Armatimonas sp.]